MPLGLDPDQTVAVWLASDAGKPIDTRPVFYFKYLTARELTQVQSLRAQARDEQDNALCKGLIQKALAIGLRGWKNMARADGSAVSYVGELDEVCTLTEQWELLNEFPSAVQNSEALRANFPSPSPSPSASSAKEPAGEEATALKPTAEPGPPSPSPSTLGVPAAPAAAT